MSNTDVYYVNLIICKSLILYHKVFFLDFVYDTEKQGHIHSMTDETTIILIFIWNK